MVKEGNEIKEFNRHLFETMVEKVIVGEGDDPYKIKFFLKTKPMRPSTSSRTKSARRSKELRINSKQPTLQNRR